MNIVIPGKIPSKKNSKRIVKRGTHLLLIPSKAHKSWHSDAMILMASEKNKMSAADRNNIPLRKLDQIEIGIYSVDARKFDLTNKAESVMDLLVDCGIIEDDNISVVRQLCLHYLGVDRVNPRAIVEIKYG